MLHESVRDSYKEVIVKNEPGVRLTLKKYSLNSIKGLQNIDFVQESLNVDGTVAISSTYNFFMTESELKTLAQALTL